MILLGRYSVDGKREVARRARKRLLRSRSEWRPSAVRKIARAAGHDRPAQRGAKGAKPLRGLSIQPAADVKPWRLYRPGRARSQQSQQPAIARTGRVRSIRLSRQIVTSARWLAN